MNKKNFSYDDVTDSLIVSRKTDNDKVDGSAIIGDLVLDFTIEGKLVNVEFMNLSKFLKFIGVDMNLNELTEAELVVREYDGAVSLFFLLKTNDSRRIIPLATVPMSKPIPAI